MNLATALADLLGISKELKAATAEVLAAKQDNTTLTARIVELEAAASAAPSAERIAELEGEVIGLTARAEKAEASQADFDAQVAEAANASAASIVASSGTAPVSAAISGDTQPLLKQLEAMPAGERSQFIRNNRAAVAKAYSEQNK